ncbi:creatininase family protein [Paenibacillus hexagrammi]|uniref:Creatininase family protein n=1 Tax=Paenibacillus hexagrammi TaxID=2908839 RepID=A0ABY3SR27_9BACL|nr:creatininase family protein [Paenibacillus sp. YPD9-1]UJF35560.1 creatininase family protein [Paenibacillus sp. YPD9-1]
MNPNTGGNSADASEKTLWSELLPYEFKKRLAKCPVVYVPLGLCEPHGQVSAFGLDTIKAEWLCQQTARIVGGIVAPSLGYHIHESGYHARWLEETVGEENPHMTSVPPAVLLYFFLYQLRAFVNAGFKMVVVITGHSGGNQEDLRRLANLFMTYIPIRVWVKSDPELVEGIYMGDHAGKYELSQLMYIRPDLVDMNARILEEVPLSGGRLALGSDADEASPEWGKQIMDACLSQLCTVVSQIDEETVSKALPKISYSMIETIWSEFIQSSATWVTANPWQKQQEVSPNSQWKPYEHYKA